MLIKYWFSAAKSWIIFLQLFDREWKASIAKDNGRAEEFTQRRNYPDKSRCYECGEFGHLSYKCPKNALGSREPPMKNKKHKRQQRENETEREVIEDDDSGLETLGAAIRYEVHIFFNVFILTITYGFLIIHYSKNWLTRKLMRK